MYNGNYLCKSELYGTIADKKYESYCLACFVYYNGFAPYI